MKKQTKKGIKMNECFECGCVGFLEEGNKCSACGSTQLFETLVTEEEYNFHLKIHRMDLSK